MAIPNGELTKHLEQFLRRANTILFERGRAVLQDLEISELQFNALISIQEYGPQTMGELCKSLFVACSTATDLADRMELVKLVERVRDDKDRRIVRLHLLSKGKAALEAVIAERHKFLSEVLTGYTDRERNELSYSLELLTERMELKK
ncbi:MarR family winged helix-turn-helix transcriptional regulator [Desulfosporosinus nitroreducens]|uniref:MarR family transcriptional regulator n=1 Tax=Desulfosporosinus nitroreducens TaxID=2018668 RepID=A0ABT8QV41_9FIRM|nr:MarR family transcriptional regulator [Desulfosporosinus nitroreducens]MDO0824429.1 MarR family transcriptional regulator [Desulfosporosinus nitroreducens]